VANVRLHADARDEIAAAFEWYQVRSGTAAQSFLEELDSTWDSIFEQVQTKVEPRKDEKR